MNTGKGESGIYEPRITTPISRGSLVITDAQPIDTGRLELL